MSSSRGQIGTPECGCGTCLPTIRFGLCAPKRTFVGHSVRRCGSLDLQELLAVPFVVVGLAATAQTKQAFGD